MLVWIVAVGVALYVAILALPPISAPSRIAVRKPGCRTRQSAR